MPHASWLSPRFLGVDRPVKSPAAKTLARAGGRTEGRMGWDAWCGSWAMLQRVRVASVASIAALYTTGGCTPGDDCEL